MAHKNSRKGAHLGHTHVPHLPQGTREHRPQLQRPGSSSSLSPASLCGLGTVPGDPGQRGDSPTPTPTQAPWLLTRGRASVSEASKLFRRRMWYRCGGSRMDSGRLTLGGGDSQALLLGTPGCHRAAAPGPTFPPSHWQAKGSPSAAAATQLPPGVPPALATHRTCAGSARVSGPRWSREVLHRRQGVPGSEGTRNRRRLTR